MKASKSPLVSKVLNGKHRNLLLGLGALNITVAILALSFLVFVIYQVVVNVIMKRESFKPSVDSYREDKAVKDYYINEEVHVGQKGLLEKFVSMLC